MNLLNILLNAVSPPFSNKIKVFIKSLKQDFSNSNNEWDQFAVKILYTLFEIKD